MRPSSVAAAFDLNVNHTLAELSVCQSDRAILMTVIFVTLVLLVVLVTTTTLIGLISYPHPVVTRGSCRV